MPKQQRKVGKCIYCHQVKPFGKEHYLPRSLGTFRGLETLNDRICTDCNNSFSEIEKDFSRTSPEAFHRKMQGIKGRKHHQTHNPFQQEYSSKMPMEPIRILGKPPGEDLEVLWEPNEGCGTMRQMCQIAIQETDGSIKHIRITDEMLEIPAKLENALKQINLDNIKEFQIMASTDEGEKIAEASRKVFPAKEMIWKELPEGDIQTNVMGLFIISPKYVRAIAKIAFHYFLKHIPRYRGDEMYFKDVREFIQSGEKITSTEDLQKFVEFTNGLGCKPNWRGHLLAATVDDVGFRVQARFFVGEGPDVTHEVFLGENPSRISYQEICRHKFVYFDKTHVDDRFSGELKEI